MKKIISLVVIIVAIFGALLAFDVAKPKTTEDKVKFGVWYLKEYGLSKTEDSSAWQHFMWRFSEIKNKK